MSPDYVMNGTSDMGRKLLFAFSSYEIEQESKDRKRAERNRARNAKRGGR